MHLEYTEWGDADYMLQTKAVFMRKDTGIEPKDCVIDKVIRLSGAEFDQFSRGLLREWDFLRDNPIENIIDGEGRYHCLLVVGEGRRDGILVNTEGGAYARYNAFMPNAEDFLTVGRYPALAELNTKLTQIVDIIAEHVGEGSADGRGVVDLERWETLIGIDFTPNAVLIDTVINMLCDRPEIEGVELDKNELIIYRNTEVLEPPAADLTDPTVTKTDMYAYGYGWDGMIPLGEERALALFDSGHEVFRLYENDAEGAADSRDDIESFDGLFGVEDPAWVRPEPEQEPLLQVFILNRESRDRGEPSGEWLTLPVLPGDLGEVFTRIGIDRPSEGAFIITAVRVRDDCVRDHISKYDSLDELNLLASYMDAAENYYEYDTFRAVLASGVAQVGNGVSALINLLDTNNMECFELIAAANDVESLAVYYDRENDEKPDDINFEDYGKYCVREEGGRFTEWGYIKQKYNDFSQRYNSVVPEEYQITGMALHALRLGKLERGGKDEKPSVEKAGNLPAEKPSVLKQIKAAREMPGKPRKTAPGKSKKKDSPAI